VASLAGEASGVVASVGLRHLALAGVGVAYLDNKIVFFLFCFCHNKYIQFSPTRLLAFKYC
jgi:hypothetical protein